MDWRFWRRPKPAPSGKNLSGASLLSGAPIQIVRDGALTGAGVQEMSLIERVMAGDTVRKWPSGYISRPEAQARLDQIDAATRDE